MIMRKKSRPIRYALFITYAQIHLMFQGDFVQVYKIQKIFKFFCNIMRL